MNLHDLFAIPCQRTPQKVAIDFSSQSGSTQITYQDLFARADLLASALLEYGLTKGDRVAFYLSSRPEFVVAYLAVIRIGAVMVPINLRYRKVEIGHILDDATPRLIVTERVQTDILNGAEISSTSIEKILYVDAMDNWTETAGINQWPVVEADDLAMIMYTSGTTGRSKGAMITHNNIMATVTGLISAWAWQADDRLLLCLPLFHTHGLVVGMHCALAAGATVLLHGEFNAAEVATALSSTPGCSQTRLSGHPTLFFAVPTIYVRLVAELQKREQRNFDSIRLLCSGSAPLAPETFAAIQELTGHTILERYGMTETGMNFSNPYAGPRLPGSVGTPLPGVSMRIVDDDLNDVEPGMEGELLVRGSNVFAGYWQAPDKTAESFCHDSLGRRWFKTGDLARQDPDTGYVTLLGRRHELIISGGFNIYPREIEELLVTFPGVAEAAVVGRSDAEWGEVPVAYLVCTQAIDDGEITIFCRGQLAGYKIPKTFIRLDTLPRNAMGKLQKHLL